MAVATADEAALAERFAFLVIDHPVREFLLMPCSWCPRVVQAVA